MGWSAGTSLRGKTGPGFRLGTTAPSGTLGQDGDVFLNRTDRQLYRKDSGSWVKLGTAYSDATVGTAEPGSDYGSDSDIFYRINGGTTTLWRKAGPTWSQVAVLTGAASTVPGPKGDPGQTGAQGAPGEAGAKYHVVDNVPGANFGAVGDFAYYPATQTFFSKTSTGWLSLGSVKGLKGDTGAPGADSTVAGPKGDKGDTGAASTVPGPKGDPGAQPPGAYTGNGAPSSTNPSGIITAGSSYIDVQASPNRLYTPYANGAWPTTFTLIGAGPKGDPGVDGANNLGAVAAAFGPAPYASSLALTTTPQIIPVAGSTGIKYTPIWSSSFMGAYIQNNATVACTFALVNQTTGATVFSQSVAASSVYRPAVFNVTQYPLTSAQDYVWTVAAASAQTASIVVMPLYTFPSSTAAQMISYYPTMGYSASKTINTTAQTLPLYGDQVGTTLIGPLRAAGIYAIQTTMVATGSTATTATASLLLYSQPNAGGTATLVGSYGMTADGTNRTVLGPRTTDLTTFNTANRYFWQVTANPAISVTLAVQVSGYV